MTNSSDLPPLRTLITPEMVAKAKDMAKAHLRRVIAFAPITSLQMVVGVGIFALDAAGVMSSTSLLFHPRLIVSSPSRQWYRMASSFFVLGLSFGDLTQRLGGLFVWQATFEQNINGADGSGIKDSGSPSRHKFKYKDDSTIRPFRLPDELSATEQKDKKSQWIQDGLVGLQSLFTNRFLAIQLLSAAIIVAIELSLLQNTRIHHEGLFLHIFPYTLYPILEHAIRWLWAITANDRDSVPVFGFLRLEPVYIPFIACGLSGFSSLSTTIKGLATALLTSKVLDLKRWNGQSAFDWFCDFGVSWYKWISIQISSSK